MSRFVGVLISASILGALPFTPLAAQGAPKSAALELAKQAEKLKPGEWVWKPEIAKTGPVLVYVDLGRQRATVYRNGIRIGVSTISSGKDGHETPTGVFTILEKKCRPSFEDLRRRRHALSAAADLEGHRDARGQPARFPREPWLRAAADGICQAAVHRHSDGRDGGHCRRPRGPGQAPRRGRACPSDGGRQSGAVDSAQPQGAFTWTPAASPSGPVSIIISTGDQQVVVLRNGVEIGRAHADVQQPTTETQVMTLAPGKDKQWIQVGVGDLTGERAEIISTERVEQMHLPPSS